MPTLLFSSNFNDGFTGWTKTESDGTVTEVNSGGRTFARHSKPDNGYNQLGLRKTTSMSVDVGHTIFFDARHSTNCDFVTGLSDQTSLSINVNQTRGFEHESGRNSWGGFPASTLFLASSDNAWTNFKIQIISLSANTADIYARSDDGSDPTILPNSSFTLLQHQISGIDLNSPLYWQTNLFTGGAMNVDISRFRWYSPSNILLTSSGSDTLTRAHRKKYHYQNY